jgi:hypothetical protein
MRIPRLLLSQRGRAHRPWVPFATTSLQIHDIVIGLFVNRYEFGFALNV